MSRTIYVPKGDDEVIARLIPQLHKMAKGRQNARRGTNDTE